MSDSERSQVIKSLLAFAGVLIAQTVAVSWWAATMQANVNHTTSSLTKSTRALSVWSRIITAEEPTENERVQLRQ